MSKINYNLKIKIINLNSKHLEGISFYIYYIYFLIAVILRVETCIKYDGLSLYFLSSKI